MRTFIGIDLGSTTTKASCSTKTSTWSDAESPTRVPTMAPLRASPARKRGSTGGLPCFAEL